MIHPVAVLGGGLAGAATALRLAQAGLRPIWLAAETAGDFKPGEHLSAAAIPLLATLGSDAMLRSETHRQAHSTYSAWGSDRLVERNAIVQLEGPPIVLDRSAFEAALCAQAVAAGAERIACDVTDLSVAEGQWLLEAGQNRIKAGFVFDATGRKAVIASRVSPRFQADKLCCTYALYAKAKDLTPRPVTLIEATEHGWWYLSVLADQRLVLNYFTDADLASFPTADFEKQARGTEVISAYLMDYGYELSSRPGRITTNSSWISPVIGPGWAAVGDAAAAFDPLSSHGMTTALWTAIEAAEAFIAQDRPRMQSYAEAVARGVQDYLTARQAVYSRETRWPQSPFWARRHASTA
ncbi:glycine oxidase maturase GoxB [Phaeobacter sp. 11ANDIMAR09]|uniref:glycine oxidase maturase GoxB n=1 Tax=Phaeobacter sp. 11ANDIMAR09 TaxID=1225647 RepID=UPI0006C8D14C|nr:glycine oxidase maturase GoxB [Phaeobacter sp. 11ANDIMAR09]KPD10264.1 hypothetical protein AN476_21975 [Phaeobacter sp. 11ANDIMAR09]